MNLDYQSKYVTLHWVEKIKLQAQISINVSISHTCLIGKTIATLKDVLILIQNSTSKTSRRKCLNHPTAWHMIQKLPVEPEGKCSNQSHGQIHTTSEIDRIYVVSSSRGNVSVVPSVHSGKLATLPDILTRSFGLGEWLMGCVDTRCQKRMDCKNRAWWTGIMDGMTLLQKRYYENKQRVKD